MNLSAENIGAIRELVRSGYPLKARDAKDLLGHNDHLVELLEARGRLMLTVEVERLRTAEGDAMTYKAGMENVAQQRDQLKAENAGLKTGYEAYEQVNAGLKAEVEWLRKDSESYRLLSFCHGQGTLELVRSHHELCAEIRRLKIIAGEPVPPTPEEFVGPSPEGPTARIRRKLAALGQGEQS